MSDVEPPEFCTTKCVGQQMTDPCRECGHLVALHVGVDHCPVCELVHHNRQMQAAMAVGRIEVHVTGVDERTLERVIDRLRLRAEFAMREPGRHFRR